VLLGKKQFRPDFLPDKARGSSAGDPASPEMLAASGDEPNSSPAAANSSPEMFRSSGEAGGAGRVTQSASPEPLGLSFEKFAGSPEPERVSDEPDNFAPDESRLSPDETAHDCLPEQINGHWRDTFCQESGQKAGIASQIGNGRAWHFAKPLHMDK